MPLDIAVGILLSLGVSEWFGVEATPLFLLFGIGAALLPDIDILPFFWRTSYDHRSLTHYPAIYIPLSLVVYAFLGPLYATLFALAVMAHLIHDTIGLGWGISWTWPFSKRKFLLFPEKGRREQHGVVMSWTPQEEVAMAAEHHNSNWLAYYYFRLNLVAYIEYGAFIVSLIALYLYFT